MAPRIGRPPCLCAPVSCAGRKRRARREYENWNASLHGWHSTADSFGLGQTGTKCLSEAFRQILTIVPATCLHRLVATNPSTADCEAALANVRRRQSKYSHAMKDSASCAEGFQLSLALRGLYPETEFSRARGSACQNLRSKLCGEFLIDAGVGAGFRNSCRRS
jgi:hypothetical protein